MAAAPMIPPDAAPAFLATCGWEGCDILPLAGDASFRRYFRVVGPGRSAVLMDAPPPHEDPRPFIAVARHLHRLGFAAPGIIADDPAHGLVLIEDFGDARMAEAIASRPEREIAIYEAAVDLLLELGQFAPAADLRPYDMAEYQREVGLFSEWYAPALSLDIDVDGYRKAWEAALAPIAGHRSVTVLRDYHAENIMLLDDGERLGLLDFQDALAGHPAYDLVSLLQDARRDVRPALEVAMIDRYRARALFDDAAYALLGAQRNTKILGIFTRLWKRDGKPRYLGYQPRVWGYLERDLSHPALTPVTEWFARNVPEAARAAAWETLPA
jgi:aminoglycoside/choline kinase family phosphotransferase